MMKRVNHYSTVDEQHVKTVILYVHETKLYYDEEHKIPVPKKELVDLFLDGCCIKETTEPDEVTYHAVISADTKGYAWALNATDDTIKKYECTDKV